MTLLGTTTKAAVAGKATKELARRPAILGAGARSAKPAAKVGYVIGKPLARREARQRVERFTEAARTIGDVLVDYAPRAMHELGLVEPPKPKRTAPRVAAGAVLGATAMYLLEPGHGQEHRQQLRELVT